MQILMVSIYQADQDSRGFQYSCLSTNENKGRMGGGSGAFEHGSCVG